MTGKTVTLQHKTIMMKQLLFLTLALAANLSLRAQTIDTLLYISSVNPIDFSVKVPDGNYRVTVTLGSKKRAAQTIVRAESRRHYTDVVTTKKGQFQTVTFTVNKHEPLIDGTTSVKLKPRELHYKNWDNALNLQFCGSAPAVQRITIEPDSQAVTVFLCGNSTVVDQEEEPWASWGQMITRWFDERVVIANYAESGLSATTFLAQLRLDKIMTQLRQGDYVICEFGHNDEKEKRPGDGAWYSYSRNLKIFADRVRQKGGHIIFVTPTARRFFNDDHRTLRNTHGDYPEAMRTVAQREDIPYIELNGMTHLFYEALGFEGSKRALVHYPANTFPNQPQALEDNTHFNPFGAWEVAKMIVMGLKQMDSPLVQYLRKDWKDFDPSYPDNPDGFVWYPSGNTDLTKPDGN
jgi:lysophospholipase L1-like esterase